MLAFTIPPTKPTWVNLTPSAACLFCCCSAAHGCGLSHLHGLPRSSFPLLHCLLLLLVSPAHCSLLPLAARYLPGSQSHTLGVCRRPASLACPTTCHISSCNFTCTCNCGARAAGLLMRECVQGSGRLWGMDIIACKWKKEVWESGRVQMGGGRLVATCRRWVREALFSGCQHLLTRCMMPAGAAACRQPDLDDRGRFEWHSKPRPRLAAFLGATATYCCEESFAAELARCGASAPLGHGSPHGVRVPTG